MFEWTHLPVAHQQCTSGQDRWVRRSYTGLVLLPLKSDTQIVASIVEREAAA